MKIVSRDVSLICILLVGSLAVFGSAADPPDSMTTRRGAAVVGRSRPTARRPQRRGPGRPLEGRWFEGGNDGGTQEDRQ